MSVNKDKPTNSDEYSSPVNTKSVETLKPRIQQDSAINTHALVDNNKREKWGFLYPLVGLVALILLWEGVVRIFHIKHYIFPSPTSIFIEVFSKGFYRELLRHSWVTLLEALIGYLIGVTVGFLVGVLFAKSKTSRAVFVPYVVAATTVPIIAFAPVVVIWFGSGMISKVIIVAFLTFFPVALGTMKGLMSTDRVLSDLFHCYSAGSRQTFLKLELIYGLPYIFTTLRMATPTAVISAIIAEFVASEAGLGYLVVRSWYAMQMSRLWGTIIVSCIVGSLAYSAMTAVDRMATPWHESSEEA